jgi:hypothetical protein
LPPAPNPPTIIETPIQLGIPSTTQIGTPVKSYTEKTIADYFTKNNIKYEYEPVVWGGRRYNKTMHPDFYLPDFDVYVEYWGLVDVPDEAMRKDYVRKMKWKMAQYHNQGIKFVSIYPNNLNNFDYVFPKKFEEVTGLNFPIYPRSTTTPYGDGSLISCRYCNAVVRKGERLCGFCGRENP